MWETELSRECPGNVLLRLSKNVNLECRCLGRQSRPHQIGRKAGWEAQRERDEGCWGEGDGYEGRNGCTMVWIATPGEAQEAVNYSSRYLK